MKYKDKNLQIEATRLSFYDPDRPAQALIDLFNPPKNRLQAQAASVIIRAVNILHEASDDVALGVADKDLHCLMPAVIYSRPEKALDEIFSLSNQLVIRESQLARDLLISRAPKFFTDPKELVLQVFNSQKFVYLVINIKEKEAIATSIDHLASRKGILSIHNPEYNDTNEFMKYCLDKNIHMIEHVDGSADIIRI